MSILDTFYIMFKSDTSDVEKGQKRVDKSTQETQDRVKKTNDDVMALGSSFLDLSQKFAAAMGVTLGLGAAIGGIFSSNKQTLQLGMFSKNIGSAVGEVDALSRAAMRMGASFESSLATQQQFSEGLSFMSPYAAAGDSKPMPTAFSSQANVLGIKVVPGMTEMDVGKEINKRLQGQDSKTANVLLKMLGVNDIGWQRLLKLPSDQYDAAIKKSIELGVQTDKNTQRLDDFYKKWNDVWQVMRNIGVEVGNFVLDPATIEGFKKLGQAIAIAGTALTIIFAPAILVAVAAFVAANAVILVVTASIAALWAFLMYGPKLLDAMTEATINLFKTMGEWADDATEWFKGLFDWITKGVEKLERFNPMNLLSKTSDEEPATATQNDMLKAASLALKSASSNPISSQTNSSVVGGANSIKIEKIEVITQATDADGIAGSIDGAFRRHINGTIGNYSSNVRA